MNIEERNGVTVLRRTGEPEPPRSFKNFLIGKPLATADAPRETIGKAIGLAVFASDALSSTAYATQEMLGVLIALGTAAYGIVFPMSLVIVALLGVVTLSYVQTINAYPRGGGAYIVSRDNLGDLASMVAASALLMDYILTVAVSISSGVAQIISAFPFLFEYRVYMAVGLVGFIMLINLRGVRESGLIFAIPTYFFVLTLSVTLIVGLVRYFSGGLGVLVDPPEIHAHAVFQGFALFLLLQAFSNGTSALTGVEAISDGVPAFREPRSRNASMTLIIMSSILATLLLGISFLAAHIQAVPSEAETLISQLARTIYNGRDVYYLLVIAATTVILIMAANTSFADFPRLSAFAAADGFLPRQLAAKGSRLVFSRGIMVLALLASLVIIIFNASVTRLIPLYAIGVFLSFTISQSSMARRWFRSGKLAPGQEVKTRSSILRHDPRWKTKMVINGFGAVCTAVVMVVFSVTKFTQGAWMVLILIPSIIIVLSIIHKHYMYLASKLTLDNYATQPRIVRHRVILPIGGVHRGTISALRYAMTLSDDVTAVHVSIDPDESAKVQEKWETWGQGVRLVIIESQYRRFMEPLLEYIDEIDRLRKTNEIITIVVPQFVPQERLADALHMQTAAALRKELMFRKGIVITNVPYLVE
jgi:amino acid transporter